MTSPPYGSGIVSSGSSFDLVLASTSPYRRALFERLGIPFRVRAPMCDESSVKAIEPDAMRLAERLANAKAASLRSAEPVAIIIGGDQVVSLEGQVLGKPVTAERAIAQLLSLSGKTHELITAMVVINEDRVFRHTDVTKLRMRQLSRREIERYVAKDQPLDSAGSYKIESRGIGLFESIESDDQTAIMGLPLIALVSILRELGYEIP
jgi:septum formation protein